MKPTLFVVLTTLALASVASADPSVRPRDGMSKMPKLAPKKSYAVPTVEAGEALLEQRGYGDQEPMVRMMNLMMVDGSGYEGMDMAAMGPEAKKTAPHSDAMAMTEKEGSNFVVQARMTPERPQVGANTLVLDIHLKADGKPAPGLKIKAQVSMTSMDMGTEEPAVREIAPGLYQIKAVFSMQGPWAVKLRMPEGGEKTLHFEVGSAP